MFTSASIIPNSFSCPDEFILTCAANNPHLDWTNILINSIRTLLLVRSSIVSILPPTVSRDEKVAILSHARIIPPQRRVVVLTYSPHSRFNSSLLFNSIENIICTALRMNGRIVLYLSFRHLYRFPTRLHRNLARLHLALSPLIIRARSNFRNLEPPHLSYWTMVDAVNAGDLVLHLRIPPTTHKYKHLPVRILRMKTTWWMPWASSP